MRYRKPFLASAIALAAVAATVPATGADASPVARTTTIFRSSFNHPVGGTLDRTNWYVFDGVAAASSVGVADGTLTLTARPNAPGSTTYDFGRVANKTNFLYGHGRVTYRVDPQRGVRAVIGLWPAAKWTATDKREADMVEMDGKTPARIARTESLISMHYLSCDSKLGCMQKQPYYGSFYDWNTLSWNWQPGLFDIYNNGVLVGHFTGDAVPHAAMHLFVNQGLQPGVPAEGTGRLQLGSVSIWK